MEDVWAREGVRDQARTRERERAGGEPSTQSQGLRARGPAAGGGERRRQRAGLAFTRGALPQRAPFSCFTYLKLLTATFSNTEVYNHLHLFFLLFFFFFFTFQGQIEEPSITSSRENLPSVSMQPPYSLAEQGLVCE